jgi:hypothetical protein
VQKLWVLVQQRLQLRGVSRFGGVERLSLNRERVDAGLERTPAREPVLPGKIELSVGKLRGRIDGVQLLESALGLFAQPLEIGSFR